MLNDNSQMTTSSVLFLLEKIQALAAWNLSLH